MFGLKTQVVAANFGHRIASEVDFQNLFEVSPAFVLQIQFRLLFLLSVDYSQFSIIFRPIVILPTCYAHINT